tara:strand:+ start:186 stop:989 length:804 start_codon:yes stop_codon:yes gene_type:complete
MKDEKFKNYRIYYNFLNKLAKDLTRLYYKNLDRPFKVVNKSKKKGYDPVTLADRTVEKFIRLKIKKKFPNHQIIGEELGYKKTNSDYTWILDPIDGTRSFIIGNPTWSNLISLNYKGKPVIGLANFPKLNKYYLNISKKIAYVFEKGKKRKLRVNKKVLQSQIKVAGAFHGWLSLNKQKKIPKVLKLMQYPCFDALTYCQLCEGRIDGVLQCLNQIWDIHPIIPIVKASGGVITTWKNEDAVKAGNILVSSNITTHNKILKLLKPVR